MFSKNIQLYDIFFIFCWICTSGIDMLCKESLCNKIREKLLHQNKTMFYATDRLFSSCPSFLSFLPASHSNLPLSLHLFFKLLNYYSSFF